MFKFMQLEIVFIFYIFVYSYGLYDESDSYSIREQLLFSKMTPVLSLIM